METSTDMDYDDFSLCPPSPCDVEFVNANIVIDGKSSIRQKPKDSTVNVKNKYDLGFAKKPYLFFEISQFK